MKLSPTLFTALIAANAVSSLACNALFDLDAPTPKLPVPDAGRSDRGTDGTSAATDERGDRSPGPDSGAATGAMTQHADATAPADSAALDASRRPLTDTSSTAGDPDGGPPDRSELEDTPPDGSGRDLDAAAADEAAHASDESAVTLDAATPVATTDAGLQPSTDRNDESTQQEPDASAPSPADDPSTGTDDDSTTDTPCEGCTIGESCVADGTLHSTNPCLVCNVTQSLEGWVANTAAECGQAETECSARDTCSSEGQCAANDIAQGQECGEPGYACDGAGACVSACAEDQRYCGGGCADVLDNKLHCGRCDTVCSLDGVCAEGECSFEGDISVLDLEQGEGGFTLDDPTGSCGGLSVATLGDLNNDGKAEFAASGLGSATIVFGASHEAALDLSNIGNAGVRVTNSVDPKAIDAQLSAAGDVNGDGISDFVAYLGDANAGTYRVVFTPNTNLTDIDLGTTTLGGFTIAPPGPGYFFARGAGDVNGDGKDDVLAWQGSAVSVIFGKQSADTAPLGALPQGSGLEFSTPEATTRAEADRAGDVNGDGKGDVLIGLRELNVASLVFGRTGGWGSIDPVSPGDGGIVFSGATGLGELVAPAGDFNGDGSTDVLVSTGSATWLIYGTSISGALDVSALGGNGFRIDGNVTDLALAGDINRDGYSDVLLGDREYGPDREGAAYVIFGGPQNTDLDLSSLGARGQRITGFRSDDNVGNAVAGGDFDGDGFDDIVIGTSCPQQGISEVYVVYGLPD